MHIIGLYNPKSINPGFLRVSIYKIKIDLSLVWTGPTLGEMFIFVCYSFLFILFLLLILGLNWWSLIFCTRCPCRPFEWLLKQWPGRLARSISVSNRCYWLTLRSVHFNVYPVNLEARTIIGIKFIKYRKLIKKIILIYGEKILFSKSFNVKYVHLGKNFHFDLEFNSVLLG